MSTAPRTLGVIAGMGLLATVAACSGGTDEASDSSATTQGGSSESATNTSDAGGGDTSDEENSGDSGEDGSSDAQSLVTAGKTALDKVGKGTVLGLESENNGSVWEVAVVLSDGSVREVTTSGDGQDVRSGPEDDYTDQDDKAENKQLVQGAKLDYEAAAKKVLDAHAGTITELELDDHDVGVVWEADVHTDGPKYEVKVDAASGEVVEDEADS